MTLATDLIEQLRQELHDAGDEPERRYSDAELLDYLNHAIADVVQRAPEANIVREPHIVAASSPPLQKLASDRATKFIKVEANRDSRAASLPDTSPSLDVTADTTVKEAPEYVGPADWWYDYTVVGFNDTLATLFRGKAARDGQTFPDVAPPQFIRPEGTYSAYTIPYDYTIYVECEMRLKNDPAPATSVNVVAGMQISESSALFNHDDTPDVDIYWSNAFDSVPSGTVNVWVVGDITNALRANRFDPTSGDLADWSYPYGAELDTNWQWHATGRFTVPRIGGCYPYSGEAVIGEDWAAAALTKLRLVLSANFSTPNAIQVRNIRLRCPELEQYDYGGAGLNLGYLPPYRSPYDDSPSTLGQFNAPAPNIDTGFPIMVFAQQEPGQTFPTPRPGGSNSYDGVGFGSAYSRMGPNVGLGSNEWPWGVGNLGGVPAGEWHGNLCYWPSEKGVDLAAQGWDGSIDDLEVSFSHLQRADKDNATLGLRYAIALEYSEDNGQTWQLDVWMVSFGNRSLALAETPEFDFRVWNANFRPNATNVRLRIEPYMNNTANVDLTPENDVLLYDLRFASTNWYNRWSPTAPLDPPFNGDPDDQQSGATTITRYVEKDVYDTYDADWYYQRGTVADNQDSQLIGWYTNFSHDPRDPTRFYLFPAPPTEETVVFVHYARVPDPITDIYDTFPLNEKWEGPVMMYMKYLALDGQRRTSYLPEQSRARLLTEYTTQVKLAREAGYSDSMRDDG